MQLNAPPAISSNHPIYALIDIVPFVVMDVSVVSLGTPICMINIDAS